LYDLNRNDDLSAAQRFYSYKHSSGTLYRLDHCFIKKGNCSVNYVDEFLENRISDHKGILIEYK